MKRNVISALLAACVLAGAQTGEFLLDREAVYSTAQSMQHSATAASVGTYSLVVWSDARSGAPGVYGARFSSGGVVPDRAGIPISTTAAIQSSPAVAAGGALYLVVWAAGTGSDTSDVYAARVTADGSVLDPDGIAVSSAPGSQGDPAVAFNGTDFVVVWTDLRAGNSDIYGARVTPEGAVLDSAGLDLVSDSAEQTGPAVAWDGTNVLLVWEDTRVDLLGDIYGARIAADGTVLDPAGFVISDAGNWQAGPAVACGDSGAMVVWHDMRDSYFADIFCSRVTRAGQVLDPTGLAICRRTETQMNAQIAFDGTNYLVAWAHEAMDGDIWASRVAANGAVLDPQGIFVCGGPDDQSAPAVAFDGENWLLLWDDTRTGPMDLNVYGTRVNGDGMLLDPQGVPVSNSAIFQERPAAASDGSKFLVVWEDAQGINRDLRGARLTRAGVVLDTPSIRIAPGGSQSYPAVTYGASNFLVVWERGGDRDRDVLGARVNPAGAVLDSAGILVAGGTWEQCAPAAASDGDNFLVAWQEWVNSSYDVRCARLSAAGTVLDTAGLPVAGTTSEELAPALVYGGEQYLAVWQRWTTSGTDVYGARITRDGTLLDPDGFDVSAAASAQAQPAAATDGTNFFVVWSDWRSGGLEVYGARVTSTGAVLDSAGIRIGAAGTGQGSPAVEFDGTNFLVVWTDRRHGEQDISGAVVTPQGVVIETLTVSGQPGDQTDPVLACGSNAAMLVAYSGWTGIVEGRPYNSRRTWGKLPYGTGTGDRPLPASRPTQLVPTIVRGVLNLGVDSRQYSAYRAELLDITGRKVLDLKPGANDVSRLSPGVYFVGEPSAVSGQPSAIRKVVLTR